MTNSGDGMRIPKYPNTARCHRSLLLLLSCCFLAYLLGGELSVFLFPSLSLRDEYSKTHEQCRPRQEQEQEQASGHSGCSYFWRPHNQVLQQKQQATLDPVTMWPRCRHCAHEHPWASAIQLHRSTPLCVSRRRCLCPRHLRHPRHPQHRQRG